MLKRIHKILRKSNQLFEVAKDKVGKKKLDFRKTVVLEEMTEHMEQEQETDSVEEVAVTKELVDENQKEALKLVEPVESVQHKESKEAETKEENKETSMYDEIDQEIYFCYISNKTGVGEQLGGTVEKLKKVEEAIAKVCDSNQGKYFKSAAKSAKFCIIFNIKNRTPDAIEELRGKGYKVTTFEKAIEFFKLGHMWDLEKLREAEKAL